MGGQNGLPVVRFDGADDRMAIAHTYTSGSVFVVAKYDTGTFSGFDGLYGGDNVGNNGHLYFTGTNGASAWYTGAPSQLNARYDNGVSPTSTIATLNQWNLFSGTDSTPQSLSSWTIASDRGAGGRIWDGDIGEIVVYEQLLSDFDRKGVEVHLDEK